MTQSLFDAGAGANSDAPASVASESVTAFPRAARVLAGYETSVTVGQAPWELPGTLTIPSGNQLFAAVVLVHGSGPNDQDETVGPNKVFKDLAWSLAERGIASIRYEKRTKHYGLLLMAKGNISLADETIDDAAMAAQLLQAHPLIDPRRVFIVGHSQGAMLAVQVANKVMANRAAQTSPVVPTSLPTAVPTSFPPIAGVAMLAPATGAMDQLVYDQAMQLAKVRALSPVLLQQELDQIKAQLERTRQALAGQKVTGPLLASLPLGFWQNWKTNPTVSDVKNTTLPVLAVFGGRDYQVPVAQAQPLRQLQASKANLTVYTYPAMNHLLFDGQGEPSPAEYERSTPQNQRMLNDLAAWLLAVMPL